jgi:pimeloyl-ACP methyl ester carboxylesterase
MLLSPGNWRRARAARRIWPGSATPPVLLVHGYGCNSGYWHHLTRELDALQVSHAGVDLEPMFADIEALVPAVAQAVEALRAATGAPTVTLVAHSMGGLVARAYMRACGPDHLARVITLGTPHHGTCLASFGVGRNAEQMRRGTDPSGIANPWLAALAASESAAARARVVSIYSCHDNIVAPHTAALLDGARNLGVAGIGHVALGRHPEVLALVRREILTATAPHMHF